LFCPEEKTFRKFFFIKKKFSLAEKNFVFFLRTKQRFVREIFFIKKKFSLAEKNFVFFLKIFLQRFILIKRRITVFL